MSTFSVAAIIEKSENRDKDLRHMALYDLNTELQKESFRIDESSQRQLAEVVLKLLDDSSSEVQGMAVKCLAPLVQKMSKAQIENSMSKLSNSIVEGEDEKRDIAKLALKTVVSKISAQMAQAPLLKCMSPLLKALASEQVEVKQDAMEVLSDILARFGPMISSAHEAIQDILVQDLASKRIAVRKRAIQCLAVLSSHTSEVLFERLIKAVLSGIEKSISGGEDLRTYIQCASAISKTAGHRFGKHINTFIPLLLKAAEQISDDEDEDEVREHIMQAFESFIIRCPDEVKLYIELMLILCKEYMEYDPNYNYDSSDDEDEDEEMGDSDQDSDDDDAMGDDDDEDDDHDDDDDEEEDYGDDDDHSDDDDITWKIRLSAVKCVGAMVKTRPDMADVLFQELCSREEYPLISRFKERTESVKLELFSVFYSLLGLAASVTTSPSGEPVITQHSEIKYVHETLPLIMKRLKLQMATRNSRIRLGIFSVMKKLVLTLQGGLDAHVSFIVPAVISALSSKDDQNITLKLEVLVFLRLFLKHHDAKIFTGHVDKLTKAVYERMQERYYKVIAESLRVCGELTFVVAACRGSSNYDELVKGIYTNVLDRLTIQDIDQDVKESAIHTMGLIIAHLNDSKSVNLSEVLPILLDRLDNEVTRYVACKTFMVIAQAKVDISSVLQKTVNELAQFLRKQNRSLRQAALLTLREFARSYPDKLNVDMYQTVLEELGRLISDADLFLAHLSLQLISQILKSNANAANIVKDKVLSQIFKLLSSSTLQGAALESLLAVLKSLVPTIGFSNLQKGVLECAARDGSKEAVQRQVLTNVGKCVASLCEVASDSERNGTVDHFVKNLSSDNDQDKMLALFTLGEIGRTVDLSGNTTIQREIDRFFDEGNEEIKNAASYALGNISLANLGVFVPRIISEIRSEADRRYLLIHSLKEIISRANSDALRPFIGDMVSLLIENCEDSLEGIRNVISECLGKLLQVDYDQIMPHLKAQLQAQEDVKRASVILGVGKYVLSNQAQDLDSKFQSDVLHFLNLLDKSQGISVRRAAVMLLNSIAHSRPLLIRDHLDRYLPVLYAECVFDKSLVRTVKLGPFSQKVDDGLDLRKAAFECLDTIIDTMKDRIDATKFVAQLLLGLEDKDADIVMLTSLILVKAAESFPEEVVLQADSMVKPMTATLKKKLKESALQQEVERHKELQQSILRAVYAMSKLPGMEDSIEFNDMLDKVIQVDPSLNAMYKSVADSDQSLLHVFGVSHD